MKEYLVHGEDGEVRLVVRTTRPGFVLGCMREGERCHAPRTRVNPRARLRVDGRGVVHEFARDPITVRDGDAPEPVRRRRVALRAELEADPQAFMRRALARLIERGALDDE